MQTKHKIQLTHAVKVSIQRFDKEMDFLKNEQFIGVDRDTHDKVQGGISAVDEFVFSLFDNVAHFRLTREDIGGYVAEHAAFFGFCVGREEF